MKHQGAWRRKTWAEWWAAALAVGARLRNEHGVGKGTFVARPKIEMSLVLARFAAPSARPLV